MTEEGQKHNRLINKRVGCTRQGGAQAVAAIVAGVAADHFRRDSVAKAAGLIGLLAVSSHNN